MAGRRQSEIKAAREMEFTWHGSRSLGAAVPMWTHLMDQHYCTPNGFNWEHGVTQDLPDGDGPPPIVSNPPSPYTEANDYARAAEFVTMAKGRAAVYSTPNILIPFGCDFTFQNANMMFKNMDALIAAINKHSAELGATARYTTLDDYAAAAKAAGAGTMRALAAAPTWADASALTNMTGQPTGMHARDGLVVRTDDFYPYADNSRSYWTGYFTSRPSLKEQSRRAHAVLRAVDFAHTFARAAYPVDREAQMREVFLLRGAEAVVQHHDGVTGTFRELVGLDYAKYLDGGMARAAAILADNVGRLATNGDGSALSADAATLTDGLSSGTHLYVGE
jgi:hypothetical protein